jgi:hypothetical protein
MSCGNVPLLFALHYWINNYYYYWAREKTLSAHQKDVVLPLGPAEKKRLGEK